MSWWYCFNDKCNRARGVTDITNLTTDVMKLFFMTYLRHDHRPDEEPLAGRWTHTPAVEDVCIDTCVRSCSEIIKCCQLFHHVRPNNKTDDEHVKIMRARSLCVERDIDYVVARLLQRKHSHFMTSDTGLVHEYLDHFSIWFEIFAEALNGWRIIHSDTQDKSGRMHKERANWTSDHGHCNYMNFLKDKRERESPSE